MDDTTVLRQRPRKHSRSMSMSMAATRASCTPLSSLLDSSDGLYRYDGPSPVATLVSLRVQVLSYLDDLENRLSQLIPTVDSDEDSDEVDAGGLNGIPGAEELTLSDEVRQWARDGLAMLQHIREDVSSRLPSLIDDATARYDGVKARLPTSLSEMSLPDMTSVSYSVPHLPDWDWKDLPDLRTRLEDVKTAVSDFDLAAYLPTLSARLTRLHAHLSSSSPSSLDFSAIPSPSHILSEFIGRVRTTIEGQDEEEDSALEKAVKDLARAAKASMDGAKLIVFDDLPHAWRNNHFVKSRYRFIPLEKWPLIIFSLFMLHNETVNIHTHLIPFFTWMTHLFPSVSEVAGQYEFPERVFLAFACLCLLSSAIWHTMSGCAHQEGMELCARVDYVGIGWLIAASVGTVVHYGFGGHPFASNLYLTLCLLMGVTGSVFPFMAWFNLREYKNYRVAFFLFLAFTALAPLAHLSALYSVRQMLAFIGPIVPSLYSYLIGLFFYVTHFPECFLSRYPRIGYWMDHIGGGSHAIWHLFIVRAIWLHKTGMVELKAGVV